MSELTYIEAKPGDRLHCPKCKSRLKDEKWMTILPCHWCGELLRRNNCVTPAPAVKITVDTAAMRGHADRVARVLRDPKPFKPLRAQHTDAPRLAWLYAIAALASIGTATAMAYGHFWVTL